jgi:hypothetical protein
VVAVLISCGPPVSEPSAVPDPTSSGGTSAQGLPPDCGAIDLRDPRGRSVELDGIWTDAAANVPVPMSWYVRTQGDCFWASGSVEDPESDFSGYTADVQIITGRIGSDFTIEGENVRLGPPASFLNETIYAPMRLLIEFSDGGEVVLREDRVLGVEGPRCLGSTFCLPVLELHRVE